MNYQEPLYRPPSEGDSLIFQISYGCPHNTCTFCPMYKGVRYKERPLKDILRDIKETASIHTDTKRIFLADGDALYMSFPKLEAIFEALNSNFPRLTRISMYANGSSIVNKGAEHLKWLKSKKLYTLYLGLESGSDKLLNMAHKCENSENMIKAVNLAQDCGIRMSVMVLLGLGGQNFSQPHATATAEVVNKMQPKFLAALRFINPPGNKVYSGYSPISEYGAVEELKNIVNGLDLKNTVFRANHSSNPVPIAARFPKDKIKLIDDLDLILKSGRLSRKGTGFVSPWL